MIFLVVTALADASAVRPERILLIVVIAAIGAVLPLSAAISELRHPRDAAPLSIDSNYIRDDRFFASSFESRVEAAVGAAPRQPGTSAVRFHDPEVIETVAGNLTIERDRVPASITDVHGDLLVRSGTLLVKEALTGGSATIEKDSSLRAIKSRTDIILGTNVRVERWVDAGRTIFASSHADLGVRATAQQSIVLEPGVVFRFVSAPMISVGTPADTSTGAVEAPGAVADLAGNRRHRIRADGTLIVDEAFLIPPGSSSKGDFIARGDVVIGDGATVIGSIHFDRDVKVGAGAKVTGAIVAERNVTIDRGGVVDGHVVAHGRASLANGARVGKPGCVTTLLADEGVEMAGGSAVYGRIITYAVGRSVA